MPIPLMSKKILIVDDDPEIVRLISELLRDEGYDIEAVTQSLRVYDRAKESRPDLILLDIMMPYLDGWDELKLFNLDEELRNIPVIIITADRNAFKGVDNAAQYGVVDHLFKPFELNDLLAKIQTALMAKS
ncbi:MAG TPA: response regulator [Chloroflexota bacterium]|nr:response regulator [Chloroflexota bacterium]